MNPSSVCSSNGMILSHNCCAEPASKKTRAPEDKIVQFAGRVVSTSQNGIIKGVKAVGSVAHGTVVSISSVASESTAIAGFYRKMEKHVLNLVEHSASIPGHLGKLAGSLRKIVSFIDFIQLFGDADYFVNRGYSEKRNEEGQLEKNADSKIIVSARVAMAAADVGGSLLWLEELGFFKLSQLASDLGKVRLFGFVPKVVASLPKVRDLPVVSRVANTIGNLNVFGSLAKLSCLSITLRALDLMYGLFALDAAKRIASAPSTPHRISASLDFVSYISELALSALLFAGFSNVVGLGIAGGTCVTMAVASFIYRNNHLAKLGAVN